ncbi:MAG: hypothetical protein ACI9JN_000221 [Bacteroidia bacterium]|jgi:hypothetical protein
MKKIFVFILTGIVTLSLSSCNSNNSAQHDNVDSSIADNNKTASNPDAQNPEPKFKFDHVEWDFGRVNEGEQVKHIYKFTNVGDEDLVISNCRATCGCTIPRWERRPIPPGESGEIEVKFNSKNKPGNQIKNVTITANTNPPETIVTFKALVLPGN